MPTIGCDIAITGVGIVSAAASNFPELNNRIPSLRHCFVNVPDLACEQGLTQYGAPAPEPTCPKNIPKHIFRRLDRSSQFAIEAFYQAWTYSHSETFASDRIGVVFASGMGGLGTVTKQVQILNEKGASRVSPYSVCASMPNAAAAHLSILSNSHGCVEAPSAACAGGAHAIYRAIELLQSDLIDVCICGATEAILSRFGVASFAAMRAVPPADITDPSTLARPFDEDRQGFVLGEGAGLLILERASTASRRNAPLYGAILSAASTFDCHDIVSPNPTGQFALKAMADALDAASIKPHEVDLLKAHATGTVLGDLAEAKAISALYADTEKSSYPHLFTPKAFVGHLISASGPVELIMTLSALKNNIVPAHSHIQEPIPELLFSPPRESSMIRTLQPSRLTALTNSFAFGGTNISFILQAHSSN